jgi:release factor glutamine methyltransferase
LARRFLDFIGIIYLDKMTSIYEPAEDSYFFEEFLKKLFFSKKDKNISYLDMGTGSGILGKVGAKLLGEGNVTVVDLNEDAVEKCKKEGLNAVCSDLFSNVEGKFDLITFNAPYLPEDSREPEDSRFATTGGKRGDEIVVEFLRQARDHLKKDGEIYVLISSLTPRGRIDKFGAEIVARKKIFQEELLVLEFRVSSPR